MRACKQSLLSRVPAAFRNAPPTAAAAQHQTQHVQHFSRRATKSEDSDDDEIVGIAGGDSKPKARYDGRLKGSSSQSLLLNQLSGLSDAEIVRLVNAGELSHYKLEAEIKKAVEKGHAPDCARAVRIRRLWLGQDVKEEHGSLPFTTFNYESFYKEVLGKACENVIGYVPIPVGFAGPLLLNGEEFFVPMATTEGALVASTNRGARAIKEAGGASAMLFRDAMTRAPVVQFPSAKRAVELKQWLDVPANFARIKVSFESTTRFGKLQEISTTVAGRCCHLRFKCSTGDAMGMNMVSKGCLQVFDDLGASDLFPDLEMLSLSGNYCTDKKPSAVNWVEGRGKSVVAEVVIPSHVIVNVLKCTVQALVKLNVAKNLVGSALAGSVGGNNAHAANVVAACFLACGQDPAQVVESANCMTLMEPVGDGDLHVRVTMPSSAVGTVGGGTALSAQRASLDLLGVGGAHATDPGANARKLAQIIAGTVLAGEISLMSALASNHLVSAHMALNRQKD